MPLNYGHLPCPFTKNISIQMSVANCGKMVYNMRRSRAWCPWAESGTKRHGETYAERNAQSGQDRRPKGEGGAVCIRDGSRVPCLARRLPAHGRRLHVEVPRERAGVPSSRRPSTRSRAFRGAAFVSTCSQGIPKAGNTTLRYSVPTTARSRGGRGTTPR